MKLQIVGILLLLLAEGVPNISQQMLDEHVNTLGYERDLAISPDGMELFFTRQGANWKDQTIYFLTKQPDGSWSKPKPAPFSGRFRDLEPFFSPDGNSIYFASARPKPDREGEDVDIWKVDRNQGGWSEPVHLGDAINSDKDEYYPSVTQEGHLYFTSERPGGVGKEDIYRAAFKNGNWEKAVALDTGVNSSQYEFNAYVSPEEDLLIFTSYGRPDDTGGGDLYFSRRKADGSWSVAQNLKEVNSAALDYCPLISPDGTSFYFTSERMGKKNGNIYMLPSETLKFNYKLSD